MKRIVYFLSSNLFAVVLLTLYCCQTSTPNQIEKNKAIVHEFVNAVNNRNLDKLDDLVAQNIVRHSQATPDVEVNNLEEFKYFLRQDFAAMPDAKQEMHMMIAEHDKVAIYATYGGTQRGQIGPFPPSGKFGQIKFMGILRIENDQIAEIWVEWDNLSMLAQLGHFLPQEDQ